MRYAVLVIVDTQEKPRRIRDEIVSALEFEHRTSVNYLAVLMRSGRKAAVYDRKEKRK